MLNTTLSSKMDRRGAIDEWEKGRYFFSALSRLALEKKINDVNLSIQSGANINYAVRGYALGGHTEQVEALLSRGANINDAVRGYALGEHISGNMRSQLCFLPFFNPDLIPKLVNAFGKLDNPISIDTATEKRAIAISKHMHAGGLTYTQAIVKTDPASQGMLYLSMMVAIFKNIEPQRPTEANLLGDSSYSLPFEIWMHIFNFITPAPLNSQDIRDLGFIMTKTYFGAHLSSYQSQLCFHGDRAKSIQEAVYCEKTAEGLKTLVDNQVPILKGEKNPYLLLQRDKKYKFNITNKTIDRYHGIIGFWSKHLNNKEVDFEEATQTQASCSIQ